MAKKFNLGDYLKTDAVSDLNTEQIVKIDLDRIDPDPNNFYSLEGIDELAANIETVGLLDALRVRPEGERYVIVSGHRRRAAILLIRDGGSEQFSDGVPCIVEYGGAPPAMRELRLIFANANTRIMSAADLSRQAERTEAVLLELKEQGVEFKGRMRSHVAEILRVSESKIARAHAIRANLVPVLLEKFDAGLLNEATAYRLSQEPQEMQDKVWRSVGISISGVSAETVGTIIDQVKKHDEPKADPEQGAPYRGREEVEEYLAQRKAEDADYLDMMTARMDGIIDQLPLIDNRQDGIAAMKKAMRWSSTGGSTVNWEGRGNGFELESRRRGIEPILRSWTEAYDALCCAALNRLGKMNANKRPAVESGPSRAPAPTWETGTPKEAGWYACWAQWIDKYKGALPAYDPDYETLFWNGTIWTNGYNSTKDAGFAVHCWYPLPPEPASDEEAGF